MLPGSKLVLHFEGEVLRIAVPSIQNDLFEPNVVSAFTGNGFSFTLTTVKSIEPDQFINITIKDPVIQGPRSIG